MILIIKANHIFFLNQNCLLSHIILHLFEDYDRVHNGTVSQSQFRRVLSELELASLVSEQDFKLLWQNHVQSNLY
jgi:Ca2+-binding EF-hand superfamily protein